MEAIRRFLTPVARAGARFVGDDGPALAGHLAFIGILSLAPFLLFVAALAGFLGATEPGTYFVAFLLTNLPEPVAETVEPGLIDIFQDRRGGLLTFSLLTVLWTTGSGIEGIRAAVNRAYGLRETRPYWRRRLEGMLLVLLFSGLFLVAALCLFFGPVLWEIARDMLGFLPAADTIFARSRYVIGGAVLFVIASVLYWGLPARHPRPRGVFAGAAATLALSLGVSALFSVYLQAGSHYASVYGGLGGIIAVLFFFYLLGAAFVYGAELTAAVDAWREE